MEVFHHCEDLMILKILDTDPDLEVLEEEENEVVTGIEMEARVEKTENIEMIDIQTIESNEVEKYMQTIDDRTVDTKMMMTMMLRGDMTGDTREGDLKVDRDQTAADGQIVEADGQTVKVNDQIVEADILADQKVSTDQVHIKDPYLRERKK